METINVNALDCKQFVTSLKDVRANTARGANFVNETLKGLSKTGLSHRTIQFIVESAEKTNDNELISWSRDWKSQTNSVKFKVGFVNESISAKKSGTKFYNDLQEKLSDLSELDNDMIVESISMNGALNDWRINPEVFNLVKQSNDQFFTADQKEMRSVYATNPIGFNVETETTVITSFDGMMLNYDKATGKLTVDITGDSELLALSKIVSSCSANYSAEQQKFIFETAIGTITVSELSTELSGQKMSVKSIIQVAGEYYKVNGMLPSKKGDINTINNVLAVLPALSENYSKLAIFSNVLKTTSSKFGSEYLITLDKGNYAVARKHIEYGGGSFKVSILSFTQLSDAIASISDKNVVSELLTIYADEIASETSARSELDSRRSNLKEQIAAIDEAIVLVTDTIGDIDETFVSREKIVALNDKKDKLTARKLEKLELLAQLG